MNPIQGVLKTKDQVRIILERYPDLRDSDSRLIANLWYLQALNKGIQLSSEVVNFIDFISKGELTSPETIRRVRQLLQEKHPELQGSKYEARHKESKKVKKLIPTLKQVV